MLTTAGSETWSSARGSYCPRPAISASSWHVNVRTPTGSQLNGNGVDSLSPHYQFWYNPYGNWAVRGGTGVTIPTNGVGGGTFYFANLGVGRYWKGAEDGFVPPPVADPRRQL